MFNFQELKVFFRGEFVDYGKANISIANTGFLYGLAVFTGMRAHFNEEQGKLYIFRPEAHFERLRFSCKLCNYQNFLKEYDFERFSAMLVQLLKLNNIKEDSYIRVTNFSDQETITPKFTYKDSLCAYVFALGNYVPTSGMKCMVSSWTRVEDNALPARAKFNGAYVNTAFAKSEALARGFEEAIFLDRYGHVIEGSAENIFFVFGKQIVTPPVSDNILEGITRRTLIELAKDAGYEVLERSVDRTELYKADEIFLTGTGAQVSPVVQIDSYAVGDGSVGPISKFLQGRYSDVVRGRDPKFRHWLLEVC